eukprot:3849424-Pleurochrysis_carterae.AAC.1
MRRHDDRDCACGLASVTVSDGLLRGYRYQALPDVSRSRLRLVPPGVGVSCRGCARRRRRDRLVVAGRARGWQATAVAPTAREQICALLAARGLR